MAAMTAARPHIVEPCPSGVFHVISQCVRNAWLCGRDPVTGRDLSHRKRGIEERIVALAAQFAIDVCAFAVTSNQLHLVLRTGPALAEAWSDLDVLRRWFSVSRRKNDTDASIEQRALAAADDAALVAEYRQRLGNLSWFMRLLGESIARIANAEDGCTGRFWEGRFRCQALPADAAILGAMTGVDPSPVRAMTVPAPEVAEPVSIRQRNDQAREHRNEIEALAPGAGLREVLDVGECEHLAPVDKTDRLRAIRRRDRRVTGSGDAPVDTTAERQQRWLKGVVFARR